MADDLTRAGMVGAGAGMGNVISAEDREILRRWAGRVAALAARKVEEEKRELWRRHNALEDTRPLIFCDPEHGWGEIITEEMLQCRGELARQWERRLRKEAFWAEGLKDDRVIAPFFDVEHIYQDSGWGMKETRIGGQHGGAYTWDAPLKSYEDMAKLHFPQIVVDAAATKEQVELAQATLGDLLQVRLRTSWWWTLGLTWTAAKLRGLEQLMLDMYDHPEELKRFMAFLRDGHLANVDFLEREGLLASNTGGDYVGSGGFGWLGGKGEERSVKSEKGERVRTGEMWGFCESQETVGVAPEMFGEFVFAYQIPLLERFGLNCYGCCEPLHLRWNVMKKTPRLRRVSVSPWADVAVMAEQLQDRYVFSYKAPPSELAMPAMDEGRVRAGLQRVRELTRAGRGGCRLEVIMKDNHTLGGGPHHAVRWVEIAREVMGE